MKRLGLGLAALVGLAVVVWTVLFIWTGVRARGAVARLSEDAELERQVTRYGCRALPALVARMDASRPSADLHRFGKLIQALCVAAAPNDYDWSGRRWVGLPWPLVDPLDAEDVRRVKVKAFRTWWSENGSPCSALWPVCPHPRLVP